MVAGLAAFFLNPGFLFIAGALISVPIIIHLINRMRFKRIRWAAMEFLLKAAKRTQRRLIIEQLLLLALRCLLISLIGLLVVGFIGCGENNITGKPNLHIVLLDDTLSMKDNWKDGGETKNCFDVAKEDILLKKIAKGLAQSKTHDHLIILPLSKLADPSFEVNDLTFSRLNNKEPFDKLTAAVKEMQPSFLHVGMIQGVNKAKEVMSKYPDSVVTVHVIGDFREKEWARPAGENLTKELLALVKDKKGDVKLRIIDTVHPQRAAQQGSYPPARDNIGILDVRPSTRITGKNTPVNFEVAIQNFSGKDVECFVIAHDGTTGKRIPDIRPNPPNPVKVKSDGITKVNFEHRFNPNPGSVSAPFEHISVRLTTPALSALPNDGLLDDNARHAVVEVRDKIPILVIDGQTTLSDAVREGKDTFHIFNALMAVEGRSFQIDFGHELASGKAAAALEKVNLRKYATIYLLNVPDFTPNQVKALENYVNDGGGVAFFLGDLVQGLAYNKLLYKDGKGLFPAPLDVNFYPKAGEPGIEKKTGDSYDLLVREDKFGSMEMVPIFGEFIRTPNDRMPFMNLPIRRYFKINRNVWKQEQGKVFELATLPNEANASEFGPSLAEITRNGNNMRLIRDDKEFTKYRTRLEKHISEMEKTAGAGSELKGYHLASQIEAMFLDKGDAKAQDSMVEFWTRADPRVEAVRADFKNLREQVQYGDPFVIARKFGKGKVVAILSTAGKDWNDFGGGSLASVLYQPFIWEMNNYLSNSGSDSNPTVGTDVDLIVDSEPYKGKSLSLVRYFIKTDDNAAQARKEPIKLTAHVEANQVVFPLRRHFEPGLWVSELVDDGAPGKPLAVYGHVFNVDTVNEGRLQRLSTDELTRELVDKEKDHVKIVDPNMRGDELVGTPNNISESPWLYLLFLFVLVAEQALAVHLSFHLKTDDSEMQPAGFRG